MTPLPRTQQMRACVGCSVRFQAPHGGPQPPGFCSPECHQASKTRAAPKQRARLIARPGVKRQRAISPASPAQRQVAAAGGCIICGARAHPAHLIDRSLANDGDGDPRAVIRLCPAHHRAYDDEGLSILAELEPHGRVALAFAVERFGLIRTLERVTNQRWAPITPPPGETP